MTNEEKIAALEAEIKDLKTQVGNLDIALMLHGDGTTKWFKKLCIDVGQTIDDVSELRSFLLPALHKLFPGIERTNKEIGAALRNRRPPSGTTTA